MPPYMPGYIVKGTILRKLDLLLNTPGRRAQFLQRISAKTTGTNPVWQEKLIDVAANMLPLTDDERKHLEKHWFGEYGWWPKQQPIDIVLRLGLIQAIGLATPPVGNPALMDCYWICEVPDVQLTSLVAPGVVTVLIFTPGVPHSDRMPEDYAGVTDKDEIYTVRHRSRGPGEHQVQPDQEYCEFVQPLVTP